MKTTITKLSIASAFSSARDLRTYERVKLRMARFSGREQLELVDDAIAARRRIVAGVIPLHPIAELAG